MRQHRGMDFKDALTTTDLGRLVGFLAQLKAQADVDRGQPATLARAQDLAKTLELVATNLLEFEDVMGAHPDTVIQWFTVQLRIAVLMAQEHATPELAEFIRRRDATVLPAMRDRALTAFKQAFDLDPEATRALIEHRVAVPPAFGEAGPFVYQSQPDGGAELGVLGVVNGILGDYDNRIAALFEDDGTLVDFAPTKP